MQKFEIKMIDEKKELDIKIEKLYRFMINSGYYKLPDLTRDQLVRQHIAMSQYSGILGERINGFTSA